MYYQDLECPECRSKRTRDLECEEHGKDCPLVICCDCGATVKEIIGISQDEYCRGCLCLPGCNVILKDGEICGDKREEIK